MNEKVELMDRSVAADLIRQLGEEDLIFLNRLIYERLKLLDQARSTTMLADLTLGDRVRFTARDGQVRSGRVVKLNTKTASVQTDDGLSWKVSPLLLERIGAGR